MGTLPKHPLAMAAWLKEKRATMTMEGLVVATGLTSRTIRKYLWVARFPEAVQQVMLGFPDVFTTSVVINVFASRQKHFEEENWKHLRAEAAKLIENGKEHRPRKAVRYPKGRAGGSLRQQRERQKERLARPMEEKPTGKPVSIEDELFAQERFRERFGTWVSVGNGEVRLKYYGKEDLERLLEAVEPLNRLERDGLFSKQSPITS